MIVPITMRYSFQFRIGPLMESERLLHPIINQIGVDTQNGLSRKKRTLVTTTNLMENLTHRKGKYV
jgi:hypothetical protein